MHSSAKGKGVGPLRPELMRLLDEKHIKWSPALTSDDHLYWFPEFWMMPAHEGVKRLKPKQEHLWLRRALSFQGPPEEVIAGLSREYGRPEKEIEGALLRMARQVSRIVGIQHDLTVPTTI